MTFIATKILDTVASITILMLILLIVYTAPNPLVGVVCGFLSGVFMVGMYIMFVINRKN